MVFVSQYVETGQIKIHNNKKLNYHFNNAFEGNFWIVKVEINNLNSGQVIIKLPDERNVIYDVESRDQVIDKTYTIYGKTKKEEFGYCIFTANDKIVVGAISCNFETYKLNHIEKDYYALYKAKPKKDHKHETIPPTDQKKEYTMFPMKSNLKSESNNTPIVRALLLYNQAIYDLYDSRGEDFFTLFIHEAISTSNTAFQNSGVDINTKVAGIFKVDYQGISPALINTTMSNDPYIQNLRTKYAADWCVIGYYDNPLTFGHNGATLHGYGGRKYEYAFTYVTPQGLSGGDFTATHEFGHVFGCNHEQQFASADYYPYGYGYYSTVNECSWHTVMAYICHEVNGDDFCNYCFPNCCPAILYFSNPNLTYSGEPLGTAINDNTRVLNEQGNTISNYEAPQDNLILGINESLHNNEKGFPVANNSISLDNGFFIDFGAEFDVLFEE